MKLSHYPRPKGDNGRGIHWSPSSVHPGGDDLSPWMDELLRMHIKWVKLLDDGEGSSLELCRRLVRYDMMPVVRIYRPQPNPGRLSHAEEETIRRLVDVGVRYFETNNEPDVPAEWRDERLPPDWLDVVVEQFIYDADRVLALGGLPGLPALSVGAKANLVEMLARKGREDIFVRGGWIAVHNYTLNHPLDYPYDPVNQEGAQLTRQDYDRWGEWAWDGGPRPLINLWRRQGMRPGSTIEDDADGWRSFELADLMAREALGFSVPVLGTEGGAVIGWRDDRRYPRVTPELHKEWTVAINAFMQTEAPAWFFTTCHWLLANFRLGHPVMGWESQAWFSDWWESAFGITDHLPAVDAVREMPSTERPFDIAEGEIRGEVLSPRGEPARGATITLKGEGGGQASTLTNARGRFRFTALPAGRYTLAAAEGPAEPQGVEVAAGGHAEVHLVLEHGRQSMIRGQTLDRHGNPLGSHPVVIKGPDVAREVISDVAGRFQCEGLPAGTYTLSAGEGSIPGIFLDGWNYWEGVLRVPLPATPRFVVTARRLLPPEENEGRHLFFGFVRDEAGEPLNGVTVEMSWADAPPGMALPTAVTGSQPDKPAGYYEFVNTPGVFSLRVCAADVECERAEGLDTASVPGREGEPVSYQVDFQRAVGRPACAESRLEVSLEGRPDPPPLFVREAVSGAECTPAAHEGARSLFAGLPAGQYRVEIAGVGVIAALTLDGLNPGYVRFPMGGRVEVTLGPRAREGEVLLQGRRWGTVARRTAAPGETVVFDGLPADEYRLRFYGWESRPLLLRGEGDTARVDVTEDDVPRESELGGQVTNADGEPLPGRRLRLVDATGALRGEQRSDRFGRYRFASLESGVYVVSVDEGIAESAPQELDGRRAREVDLTLPASLRPKHIEHYILLSPQRGPGPWLTILLMWDYLARHRPAVGFNAAQAACARRVTIVGDEDAVGRDVEERLLAAGCLVQRLPAEGHALGAELQRWSGRSHLAGEEEGS